MDLAVGELAQVGLAQLDAQLRGDVLGQLGMGAARHQLEAATRDEFHAANATAPGRAVRGQIGAGPTVSGHRPGGHLGALGSSTREGADPGVGADDRPAAHAVEVTTAPSPTAVSTSRVFGPISACSPTDAGALQDHPGQEDDVGGQVRPRRRCRWRSGSHMVTPRRIHRSLIRSRSSASATASWARSLTPAASMVSSTTSEPTRWPALVEHLDDVGQVVLALGVGRAQPAQRRAPARCAGSSRSRC